LYCGQCLKRKLHGRYKLHTAFDPLSPTLAVDCCRKRPHPAAETVPRGHADPRVLFLPRSAQQRGNKRATGGPVPPTAPTITIDTMRRLAGMLLSRESHGGSNYLHLDGGAEFSSVFLD